MTRRLRGLAPRLTRLGVFLLVVCAGLQLLAGRVVAAQVDGALLDLGAGLSRLASPGQPGPRALELNGSRLLFDTGTRAATAGQVLDEAEAGCGTRDELLRGGEGERGFVACVARPGETAVIGEVPLRGASGYRYVYAQPGDERTQVVRFWTEDSLDLDSLFPAEGDAPGTDAPGVPRPPDARRILSAREVGEPQQITIYLAGGTTARLEAWYRERLTRLGWRALDRKAGSPETRVLVVERAGSLAALVLAAEEAGTSVSILTSLQPSHAKDDGRP